MDILGLFSCATAKHDYYYTKMEGVNLKQSLTRSGMFQLDTICGTDSISFYLLVYGDGDSHLDENYKFVDKRSMMLQCYSDRLYSIDKTRSSVTINDSIYPLSGNCDRINWSQHVFYFRIPEEELSKHYSTYTDGVYIVKKEKIRGRKRELFHKQFNKQSSPLHIDAHIEYYTDSLKTNRYIANFRLHQSDLIKIKNLRYKYERRSDTYHTGEKIGKDMKDVAFYTKLCTGTVWGWPEIRLGIGYGVSSVLLPLTVPVNFFKLIGANGDGGSYYPIEYPIFE